MCIRDSQGEVIIVDEFTGRTMPGRRWSDGLHQAVEAKEGVKVREENQTVASITFQNFFRLYSKLSGMTGTADTEAFEFQQIYGLEVVVIPTHKPMIRKDKSDLVFLSEADKFQAILEDIEDCVKRGQPVLVGTTSKMCIRDRSSREQQLGVLENLILTRELNKQVYPEGRPVEQGFISSYFGGRADPFTGYSAIHKGIDFAAPEGTKVSSCLLYTSRCV